MGTGFTICILCVQAFFSETTYQKSILESKNKVYQKICGTKPKLPNIDFSPVDDLMNLANSRFQVMPFMHTLITSGILLNLGGHV